MDVIGNGLRFLARGARRGSASFAGLGAAMLALGWLRRSAAPKRRLLYSRTLKPGDALRIRLLDGEGAESIDVEG
jgi:hypothetical protein